MSAVCVIIPAFRAHATIVRAVESLLAQTRGDWEAIVVSDDGSDYAATLTAAGIDDPRIRHASTGKVGSGPAAARNAGLDHVDAALIAPLDADDRFAPERLAELVPLAQRHGAAGSNVRVVDDASGAELSTLFPPSGGDRVLDAAAFLATSVPILFVAARAIAGRWDDDVFLCDDLPFNVRLLDKLGRIKLTARPLYEYRVRAGSVCHDVRSGEWAARGYATVLARLEADGLGIARPEVRDLLARAVARKQRLNAAFEAARARGEAENFQDFVAAHGLQAGDPAER